MPRHFGTEERDTIRKDLVSCGHELFGRYGFRKTSIEDVARAAGVSKGTFYAFFETKETFFLEVFRLAAQEARESLTQAMLGGEATVREAFVEALHAQLLALHESPILQVLAQPEEYHFLFRQIKSDRLQQLFAVDREYVEWMIGTAQEWTSVRDVDLDLLAGVMRGLSLFPLHRKEIGEEVFSGSLRFLLTVLAHYLFPEEDGGTGD